jgi:prevent-host-death family protein
VVIGVAEARRRFREVLELVERGETVEVSRRGEVVAVIRPPEAAQSPRQTFGEWTKEWRERYGVADWPDDDAFEELRDPSPGPPAVEW